MARWEVGRPGPWAEGRPWDEARSGEGGSFHSAEGSGFEPGVGEGEVGGVRWGQRRWGWEDGPDSMRGGLWPRRAGSRDQLTAADTSCLVTLSVTLSKSSSVHARSGWPLLAWLLAGTFCFRCKELVPPPWSGGVLECARGPWRLTWGMAAERRGGAFIRNDQMPLSENKNTSPRCFPPGRGHPGAEVKSLRHQGVPWRLQVPVPGWVLASLGAASSHHALRSCFRVPGYHLGRRRPR